MNKHYDLIVKKYNEYLEHNTFVEKESKALDNMRKEVLRKAIEAEADDISEDMESIIIDSLVLKQLYSNQTNYKFLTLYNSVRDYQETSEQELPKEIVTLCENYEHIVPKDLFLLENGILKEKVEGSIEKIKQSYKNSKEFKQMTELFKNKLLEEQRLES